LTRYTFKESPYSSHSQLLSALPASGAGRRILDVGCGNAYLAAILASRDYQVTGIERPGGVTGRFPDRVRLVEADLDAGLPPLQGSFDYILCADILEHLRDPIALLVQLRGVLAPGGSLVASLPNSGNLYFRLVVLSGRFPQHDKGLFDRTHLHFYTWDGWLDLLARAGFAVGRVCGTGIPVGLVFPRRQNLLPVRAAEAISYWMAQVRKQIFAYQFVVIARPV
jgi:SAM-dependent methyltransferase